MDDRRSGKGDSGSTGYTTRLNDEQARLVEEAARVLNVTTAKFIRDATLARASEVLNSQGRNALALRQLAVQIARQLADPNLSVVGVTKESPYTKKPGLIVKGSARRSSLKSLHEEWSGEYDTTEEGCRPLHVAAFMGSSLDALTQMQLGMDGNDDFDIAQAIEVVDAMPSAIEHLHEIRNALKSAPSELARYLAQELDAQGSNCISFSPVVDMESLIGGETEG